VYKQKLIYKCIQAKRPRKISDESFDPLWIKLTYNPLIIWHHLNTRYSQLACKRNGWKPEKGLREKREKSQGRRSGKGSDTLVVRGRTPLKTWSSAFFQGCQFIETTELRSIATFVDLWQQLRHTWRQLRSRFLQRTLESVACWWQSYFRVVQLRTRTSLHPRRVTSHRRPYCQQLRLNTAKYCSNSARCSNKTPFSFFHNPVDGQ